MKPAALVLLLLAGCAGNSGKLAIRTIASPVSQAAKPLPARIAEARGLLALGNVGLALESFRIAQRDDPASTDALSGIAACYDRMGRFDLSRRYYEEALAHAPKDSALLAAFAASLDLQGKSVEAASVRRELAGSNDAPALASNTVTVELPPARPVASEPRVVREAGSEAETLAIAGPRLERLSLGEVALVTTPQPRWRTEVVEQRQASTTVRFVPLAPERRLVKVRVLNAARHQGLAARTRVALARKGWERVSIGDADRVRERSLVLYSAANAPAARKISAQLGLALARDPRPGTLTLLLGRDAVGRFLARG